LASLLEALDVDDVRLAAPTERADLFCVVDGEPFWIVLPRSSRKTVRSRSTLHNLAASSREISPIVTYAMDSREPDQSPSARVADDRTRLLGELLHYAADLDPARLRLLVAHAELLGSE
jgi:hypothetical protein